jgi:gliding motility-associated-like protein
VNGGITPSYQWYNGATAVGANSPTYAYVPTNGDAITVVLTSSEICQSGGPATSNSITMIVNSTAPAGVTIVADANPVCNGTSVNFTATPVNGGTTPAYQWYNGATAVGTNSATYTYVPANGDVITVVLTSSESCATGNPATSAGVTMTVNPLLPVSVAIAADVNPICNGSTVTFTATPTNGGATPSYQWYNGATTVGANTPTYAYVPANGDVITVVLTSSETCVSGNPATSAGVTMTVNPVLPVSVTIAADVNPICAGSTVTFTSTPINGGTTPSYQWYNGATAVGVNSPTYAYAPANGDAITVVLTSSETCQSGGPATSAAVIMTVNPLPSGTTVPVDAACFGESTGSVDLTITVGTLPCTFLWSNGATTEDLTGVPAGIYTVTITDANLCSAVASGTVGQPLSALTATTTKLDVTTIGGNDGSITATGAGGTAPYLYSLNGGAYQASGTFNTLIAGVYTVTVQDMNLCTFPVTVTITQPYLPLTGSAIITPVLCFGESTGSVTVAGAEGVPPYEYSLNGGTWQSSGTFGNLAAGPYTISIRDAAANTFNLLINITQPAAALTVGTSLDNVSCNGDADGMAVALAAGGTPAYNYSWSTTPVQVNDTITDLTPGTYTVTVTDANSCTISADVTITEPAVLSIDAVPTSATCPDSDDGQIALEITGGTPAYSVLWADGDTVLTKRDLSPDTYVVVVADANGCAESASAVIDYVGTFNCVVIPHILTPDPADGHNDEWIIRNIDIYPRAEIKVYSRWGKLIYHSKNPSAEPWKGRYYNGKLVPTDSYYYILDLHDGSSIRSGVISVIR